MDSVSYGKKIIEKINSLGYEAYMVGGCVRDYLLSIPVHDVDLTTNMPLSLMKNHFEILDNGSDYESVTILEGGFEFEITHFRRDVSYSDHRHPVVEPVESFKEDAARRDFTINALAMDKDGKITDYYNGLSDLKEKIIRTIGDPFRRFEEDALRILRGLYFSSKLGFDLDPDTLFAMMDKKELLSSLSEERLYQYFLKILYAGDKGIRYINECDIFQYIPKFKRWLNLVDPSMKEEDLIYVYYGKTKRFPVTPQKEQQRLASALDILLKDQSPYALYKNKEAYLKLRNVLGYFKCDIISCDEILNRLIIREDSDLAVSKAEIASFFSGKEKSEAIEEVLKAVLNGTIGNTASEINELIGRLVLCLKE